MVWVEKGSVSIHRQGPGALTCTGRQKHIVPSPVVVYLYMHRYSSPLLWLYTYVCIDMYMKYILDTDTHYSVTRTYVHACMRTDVGIVNCPR